MYIDHVQNRIILSPTERIELGRDEPRQAGRRYAWPTTEAEPLLKKIETARAGNDAYDITELPDGPMQQRAAMQQERTRSTLTAMALEIGELLGPQLVIETENYLREQSG